jgi:hypothetical protein
VCVSMPVSMGSFISQFSRLPHQLCRLGLRNKSDSLGRDFISLFLRQAITLDVRIILRFIYHVNYVAI